MNIVITGGAGFIGSYLVDHYVEKGFKVIVLDNLSSGSLKNIEKWLNLNNFQFIKVDLKYINDDVINIFKKGIDVVFHYAANPEVRISIIEPEVHYRENVEATFNILELCRKFEVKYLVFASSSTVYGDAKVIPTPEDHPLEPVSIYGACKLACEVMIRTYSKLYNIKSLILRYANIIGARSNHGVIIDFIKKLRSNPRELEILGDGKQRKSYLHISDTIDATVRLVDYIINNEINFDVFNVGNEDWITVKEIADIVTHEMKLRSVKYIYKPATSNGRGWIGDVKYMLLSIEKLKKTINWKPKMNSKEAVRQTVKELLISH